MDLTPVDTSEEGMTFDLFPALRSVIGILLEKPSDEVLSNITHIYGNFNLLVFNALSNLVLVMRVEWRETTNHLIEQAT